MKSIMFYPPKAHKAWTFTNCVKNNMVWNTHMCLTASSHKQFENETKKSRNKAKLKTTILITIKTNKVVEWSGDWCSG